jgi:hypothetical protein
MLQKVLRERRPDEIAAEEERMKRMAEKNKDVFLRNRNRVRTDYTRITYRLLTDQSRINH